MDFPPLGPATRNLLIVSAVAFVAYTLVAGGAQVPLDAWLGISPSPSVGWSWQWATHWLVARESAGAAFRKLIELVFLYLMGTQYERLAGPRATYGLAGAGIVGAALGTFATGWITPGAPYGDPALTSALMTGLAVRLHGVPVRAPFLPPVSGWVFVIVFGVVALLDAVWWHFAPIFGSYAGTVAAAYAFERLASRPTTKKPAQPLRSAPRRKGPHPFKVIEGGGQGDGEDDDKPRYLN